VEALEISNTEKTIKDVAIMAVAQLNCYRACLRCNVRVEAADEENGRCSPCPLRGTSHLQNPSQRTLEDNTTDPATTDLTLPQCYFGCGFLVSNYNLLFFSPIQTVSASVTQ